MFSLATALTGIQHAGLVESVSLGLAVVSRALLHQMSRRVPGAQRATATTSGEKHGLEGALLQLFGLVLFPDLFSKLLLGLGPLTQHVTVLLRSHLNSGP